MARIIAAQLYITIAALSTACALADQVPHWLARAEQRLATYNYTNPKPLIGIISQPCHDCPGRSYIPAAYVKWIEAAGGRAVPIRYYDSDEQLLFLFNATSGLIFPGGLTWLYLDAPYVITARKLFEMANAANNAGDFYPIHGTCLGHQLLHILVANADRDTLLVETDAVQNPNILNFTTAAANSAYFGHMPPTLLAKLADPAFNIAYENHEMGLPPAHYDRWPELKQWYRVLTTTLDRSGIEYVSTMEGIKYPYFGTQWHPEKPPYEFSDRHIPHSRDAITVSNHMAMQFIEIARLSSHVPRIEVELNLTIYNYAPSYTARDDVFESSYDGPDACYFLDSRPADQKTDVAKWRGVVVHSQSLSEEQESLVSAVEASLAAAEAGLA